MKKRHRSRSVVSPLLAAIMAIAATLGLLALTPVASSANPTGPQLQICNVASDSAQIQKRTVFWGLLFGNHVDSTSLTATTGTPSQGAGNCTAPLPFSAGAVLGVEQGALGTGVGSTVTVTYTGSSSGTIITQIPSLAFAAVKVGASGLTTVTIDDDTTAQPGQGTLELCKIPGDAFVNGQTFNFSISGPNGFTATQPVTAGTDSNCNDILGVPSGAVTITEGGLFPFTLSSVATNPQDALVSANLQTATAVVNVNPGVKTTVFFTNVTVFGSAKVCKTLRSAADNGLAGQAFKFDWTANFNGAQIGSGQVTVKAQTFPNIPCTFLPGEFPLGTIITATEEVPSDARVIATTIDPSGLDTGLTTPGTASFFVGSTPQIGNLGAGSITEADFTNEALGQIEVCKSSNTIANGTVFNFAVSDGVGSVQASVNGFCSTAATLPVGPVTITETSVPSGVSTTWSTTNTTPTGGTGTSATVQVPFNSNAVVTFDNEIENGSFKVCKLAPAGTPQSVLNTAFPFTYSPNGGPFVAVPGQEPNGGLKPGQCSSVITEPLLTPTLQPFTTKVVEGTVTVTGISSIFLTNVSAGLGGITVTPPTGLPHQVGLPGGTPSAPATVTLTSPNGTPDVNFTNAVQ